MKDLTYKEHKIVKVEKNSIAEEMGIESGDILIWINEENIEDVFDYQYSLAEEEIEVCIRKQNGEEWVLEIEKEYHEDLGLIYENSLMDELIRCQNKCKFCFIDQLPPNMRETVYFKDDDWRMSFLNGNYITLTNMRQKDIDRLIKHRLSPINISIHATDEKVRIDLLNNRFAGRIIDQIKTLIAGGIKINGQIVLCKGINDGVILDKTIEDLSQFIPHILSLTVVPVGISKFREGLAVLEGFDEASAREVVKVVEKWQQYYLEKMQTRFIFAADEFYIKAEEKLPAYSEYEDFPVLDNGVGMLTKFDYELTTALKKINQEDKGVFECSFVTGELTKKFMQDCIKKLKVKFPNLMMNLHVVTNRFFGQEITVTGLLTGRDIVETLKQKKSLGKVLLLVDNMLRGQEQILLDDYTTEQISKELGLPVEIVPNQGEEWIDKIIEIKEKYK
ncbi:MAG: Fe/S oxidoreductase [Clostridia bacterium]|jgi:putative radical SAM enzyme (TIGR03279 family)|nr:Fe/S oxidoreductase [Clostridia bacterium]